MSEGEEPQADRQITSARSTQIRGLAVVGNRRTAALVNQDGAIVWYCPGRFDQPSLLASLLDAERGGQWGFDAATNPVGREYVDDSAVLVTCLKTDAGSFSVKDWMPLGEDCPGAVCRLFSAPPEPLRVVLSPAPDYAGKAASLEIGGSGICIDGKWWLYASGALEIDAGRIVLQLPQGEEGWSVLADEPIDAVDRNRIQRWLDTTLGEWKEVASHVTYHGPYERQVAQSLRALRLMTYADNGGIIAAATTSLPEVPGGSRNYDYRYVWLRDAGMIVSALVRAGSSGPDEELFLDFICGSRHGTPDRPLLPPFLSLDFKAAPDETHIDLAGHVGSRPVRVGNNANNQLQLDGFANVLIAAKLIYGRDDTREHWETVRLVADFLAENWHRPDFGIWEEHDPRQYTSSKALVSCGLRYIAEFAEDQTQAARWREAAGRIDEYIGAHCLTSEGAYAAFAGTEAVDVSAILLPAWGYCDADTPEMQATVAALERDYSRGDLYWRHLEELGCFQEGAFLAGTIWVAQYWVVRKDLDKARRILDAALAYSNDLGFFAEEADPENDGMLGNFPQTFVHASLIGMLIDYRDALEETNAGSG